MFGPCAVMLAWLGVDDEACELAIVRATTVQLEDLPTDVQQISCAVLDDNVDIHIARHLFSVEAWHCIVALVRQKVDSHVWCCGLCQHDLQDEQSVVCEACFQWYHLRCCGLSRPPQTRKTGYAVRVICLLLCELAH